MLLSQYANRLVSPHGLTQVAGTFGSPVRVHVGWGKNVKTIAVLDGHGAASGGALPLGWGVWRHVGLIVQKNNCQIIF